MSNPDSEQKGPIQRKEHKPPKVQEGIPKYTENDIRDDMKQGEGTTNINKCTLPSAVCIFFLMALAALVYYKIYCIL